MRPLHEVRLDCGAGAVNLHGFSTISSSCCWSICGCFCYCCCCGSACSARCFCCCCYVFSRCCLSRCSVGFLQRRRAPKPCIALWCWLNPGSRDRALTCTLMTLLVMGCRAAAVLLFGGCCSVLFSCCCRAGFAVHPPTLLLLRLLLLLLLWLLLLAAVGGCSLLPAQTASLHVQYSCHCGLVSDSREPVRQPLQCCNGGLLSGTHSHTMQQQGDREGHFPDALWCAAGHSSSSSNEVRARKGP